MSGEDGGLIVATARDPGLGFVGDVDRVNPAILDAAAGRGPDPRRVDHRLGRDGQAYNINADSVAGAIAEALGAEKIIYLTDVEGLLRDVDDPASLISRVATKELRVADRGRRADRRDDPEGRRLRARRGPRRRSAHILDGRIPHVLLLELFTDEGIGTMITQEASS